MTIAAMLIPLPSPLIVFDFDSPTQPKTNPNRGIKNAHMSAFSIRLKELRKERRMTQKQLAEAIGTTDDCVYFWEKNRSEPSIAEIVRLADYFDVSTDYLLGRGAY